MFVDDRRKAARSQDVGFLIELGGRTQLSEPLPVVGEQIGLELGPVAGLAGFIHPLVAAGKGEGVGGGRTHDLAGVDLRHDHQKLADLAGGIGGDLSGRDRQRLVEVTADPENGLPDASLQSLVLEERCARIGQVEPQVGDQVTQQHLADPPDGS